MANGNGIGFSDWLKKNAITVVTLLVAMAGSYYAVKSDIRSLREGLATYQSYNREQIQSLRTQLAEIKGALPNSEASRMRDDNLQKQIDSLREDHEFESAKAQAFREKLLSKGVLRNE